MQRKIVSIAILICFIVAIPRGGHGGEHTISVDFDITLEAANKAIAAAYYSDLFPTDFSGMSTAYGAFLLSITLEPLMPNDVTIHRASLTVDIRFSMYGALFLGGQSYPFADQVETRLGLTKDFTVASTPIQFLRFPSFSSLPIEGLAIREFIEAHIAKRLSGHVLATEAAVANALPVITRNLEASTVAFAFWLQRPTLVRVPEGLRFQVPLRVSLEADFPNFVTLNEKLALDFTATGNLDYTLTDSDIDALMTVIQSSIVSLPEWLRDEVQDAIVDVKIPIYEGRLIDVVNSRIPPELDIQLTGGFDEDPIEAHVEMLEDRIRLSFKIDTRSQSPRFCFFIKRGSKNYEFKIGSNIKADVYKLKLTSIQGKLMRDLGRAVLSADGPCFSVTKSWNRKDTQGHVLALQTLYFGAAMDNSYNLYLKADDFVNGGSHSDFKPLDAQCTICN